MKKEFTIAIIQEGPVYLNLSQSLEKMTSLVEQAAEGGAELIVFGETWLTGYPSWLDHCSGYTFWDHEPTKAVFARMYENSVSVPSPAIDQLCRLAKEKKVVIVTGINEKVNSGVGNGTIYNSLLIINSDGSIGNHHRKLMPTYTEKLLYGTGDGQGLKAVDTPLGRIGSLICWEHWMPLTRQAMHNSGEQIHIALWPQVHEMLQLASRHYAFEGRCLVIAVGQLMQVADFPDELELSAALEADKEKFVLQGGSCIFGPNGDCLLEPQFGKEKMIFFEVNGLEHSIYKEKMTLDTSGHYNRNDVFDFSVNNERKV